MHLRFAIVDTFEVDGPDEWEIEHYSGPVPERGDVLVFESEESYEVDTRDLYLSESRERCDFMRIWLRPI